MGDWSMAIILSRCSEAFDAIMFSWLHLCHPLRSLPQCFDQDVAEKIELLPLPLGSGHDRRMRRAGYRRRCFLDCYVVRRGRL